MSARQASQSSPISSVAPSTQLASGQSTRTRRNPRLRRSPPPSVAQRPVSAQGPSPPKNAGPSQASSSAMSTQSRRVGHSPTVASTTSASSIGGRLREDPLLDLLIEQQEKPLRGVVPLQGGSASEVEQAARLFLETSRRCFQTSMDAMELDEAEMESDYRSQERENVMSTWTEMLLAGRIFFDCNQYEVAFADEVKEDVRKRSNVLTDTAAYYLDKAIALFNAILLAKNINLPDSVATDLEDLGAGTVSARVTARNRVLKNLWTSFWYIVPGASREEMELWVQFSVQLSGRYQSQRILEDERVKDQSLPKPANGAFWGKSVFPDYSNLDHNSHVYKSLLTQWERLKSTARPKSVSKPPHWESFEDSVLEYIRKKSGELLDVEIDGERESGPSNTDQEPNRRTSPAPDKDEDDSDKDEDDSAPDNGDADASMAEPLDMDMFLELAQEIEAEKAISSPLVRSPKRPTLTPLIRLGPERPAPTFDWNARQKDAVQISWESQDSELAEHLEASHYSDNEGLDDLPGETQLLGADGAMDADQEASEDDDAHSLDSDNELPTMTQLQGGSLAPFDNDPTSPAVEADPDEDDQGPESPSNGESDVLADGEIHRAAGDVGIIEDDDFPTETQLHGYAGAFVGSVAVQETVREEEEEEDDFPSESQLNGHSNALAPLQPLEPLEEEEEESSALPETDDFPAPDQFEGDDEAFATQAAGHKSVEGHQAGGGEREEHHAAEVDFEGDRSPEGTQNELPDMDELAGDYAALNVSEPEEEAEAAPEEDELQTPDDSESDPAISASDADEDQLEGSNHQSASEEVPAHDAEAASAMEDDEDDELPSADQLQGDGGVWSDNDELSVAKHLDDEALGQADREESRPSLQSPPAQQTEQQPQIDAIPTPGDAAAAHDGSHIPDLPENPQPHGERPGETTASAVEETTGVIDGAMTVEIVHEEVTITSLPDTIEPPLTEPKAATPHQAMGVSGSRPRPRQSLPARFLHPRRSDLTEFATPDPEDGPVNLPHSSPNEATGHLHGPRRVHRLRTDSPTRRSQRYSPPMLLPIVPHHPPAAFGTPKTPSQAQVREPGSNLKNSSALRSASTARRIDSQTPLGSIRRQIVTQVRSEGATSVGPGRRARSVTGRLGYVAPRNDPYLHDEDGGPLEPNPDYVTPDVYPTPPQDRAERRTRVPMHRKSRRWTEGEALLLYRTIQKAWWSERTAQQVAWYLHGEWGQMSQRLRAFTVQNMKDKMREIVNTRVRNDRAVVGRARHWLPAGHPDREAYEEEMAAWADAEIERLQREQDEEEEEEERKALEAAEAEDAEMDDEAAPEDLDGNASPDEEMGWEANAALLVDLGGNAHVPQTSEDEGAAPDEATVGTERGLRQRSVHRSVRGPRASIGARWRTVNDDDEVDELESDQGENEPADESADILSVADSDLGIADHADFPPPIDVTALLNPRKRRATKSQSGTPKRRHTLDAEPERQFIQPPTRTSLPATRRKPTIYRQPAQPPRELESSETDSSEEEAVLQLPALRTWPASGTPRSSLVPQARTPAQTEPRPPRRPLSAVREAIARGAQSSPSQALRSRHGPRQSSSQSESESSDHDEFVPSWSTVPPIVSTRSTRSSVASQRSSLPAASPSDDEKAQNATIEHPRADPGFSSDDLPADTQASLGDTQPEPQVPRTTVVARARRGRGGMKRGPSRPLSVVAERTESVESRMGRPAPASSASSSSGVIAEVEAEAAPEASPPRPSQTSRLREIARKVIGV